MCTESKTTKIITAAANKSTRGKSKITNKARGSWETAKLNTRKLLAIFVAEYLKVFVKETPYFLSSKNGFFSEECRRKQYLRYTCFCFGFVFYLQTWGSNECFKKIAGNYPSENINISNTKASNWHFERLQNK